MVWHEGCIPLEGFAFRIGKPSAQHIDDLVDWPDVDETRVFILISNELHHLLQSLSAKKLQRPLKEVLCFIQHPPQ